MCAIARFIYTPTQKINRSIYESGVLANYPNYEKAFQYYQMAARQNTSSAYTCLGLMYEKGKFVDRDETTALKYYELASEKGCGNG